MLKKKEFRLSHARNTLFTAIIGVLYLMILDGLLSYIIEKTGISGNGTIIKGILFFAISSITLYFILERHAKQIQDFVNNDFRLTVRNLQSFIFKFKKREDGEFIYTFAEGK